MRFGLGCVAGGAIPNVSGSKGFAAIFARRRNGPKGHSKQRGRNGSNNSHYVPLLPSVRQLSPVQEFPPLPAHVSVAGRQSESAEKAI